ncbi:MAG: hypothetical protein IKR61_04530 [Lachnospiraceae bacterium]|nr:hypothetical protein [Lachnospiraceae bacterium]
MLKRELTRIAFAGGIGIALAIYLFAAQQADTVWEVLLIPFYCIGSLYATTALLKLVGKIIKSYFSAQFFSLLVNPLWGTILCVFLLVMGLSAVIAFGWIYGLGKCVVRVVKACELDHRCLQ